ncbi:MAG: hypothetical protein Q9227_008238 [Pyrenula ochraceoflavens]
MRGRKRSINDNSLTNRTLEHSHEKKDGGSRLQRRFRLSNGDIITVINTRVELEKLRLGTEAHEIGGDRIASTVVEVLEDTVVDEEITLINS